MAFENVQIISKRGGLLPILGWRQDLAQSDVIDLSLNDNTGVTSYKWLLVGRPEGSIAGGAGPEPVLLGNLATAGFTVDADVGFAYRDGTYIVHCVLNMGTPTETTITVGLARMSGLVDAEGRPLRRLGGFEVAEDVGVVAVGDTSIRQGWLKMLNRWLGKVASMSGPVPGAQNLNQTYDTGAAPAAQRMIISAAKGGAIKIIEGADATNELLSFLAADSDTLIDFLKTGQIVLYEEGLKAEGGFALGKNTVLEPLTLSFKSAPGAAVSTASAGRIRYNNLLTRFEVSVNGGAYVPLLTGITGITTLKVTAGVPLSGDIILASGDGVTVTENVGLQTFTFSGFVVAAYRAELQIGTLYQTTTNHPSYSVIGPCSLVIPVKIGNRLRIMAALTSGNDNAGGVAGQCRVTIDGVRVKGQRIIHNPNTEEGLAVMQYTTAAYGAAGNHTVQLEWNRGLAGVGNETANLVVHPDDYHGSLEVQVLAS